MSAPFVEIDGRRYLWRDVLEARRAQLAARPKIERTAAGCYSEPSLFA